MFSINFGEVYCVLRHKYFSSKSATYTYSLYATIAIATYIVITCNYCVMEIEPLVQFNEYSGSNNFSATSYIRTVLQESLPKMTIIVSINLWSDSSYIDRHIQEILNPVFYAVCMRFHYIYQTCLVS